MVVVMKKKYTSAPDLAFYRALHADLQQSYPRNHLPTPHPTLANYLSPNMPILHSPPSCISRSVLELVVYADWPVECVSSRFAVNVLAPDVRTRMYITRRRLSKNFCPQRGIPLGSHYIYPGFRTAPGNGSIHHPQLI
jgi:hypothetical protein